MFFLPWPSGVTEVLTRAHSPFSARYLICVKGQEADAFVNAINAFGRDLVHIYVCNIMESLNAM